MAIPCPDASLPTLKLKPGNSATDGPVQRAAAAGGVELDFHDANKILAILSEFGALSLLVISRAKASITTALRDTNRTLRKPLAMVVDRSLS
jgi:hypothetical protein